MKSIANYKRIIHSNYTTTMTTINQGYHCYTPKVRRTLNDNNKHAFQIHYLFSFLSSPFHFTLLLFFLIFSLC